MNKKEKMNKNVKEKSHQGLNLNGIKKFKKKKRLRCKEPLNRMIGNPNF